MPDFDIYSLLLMGKEVYGSWKLFLFSISHVLSLNTVRESTPSDLWVIKTKRSFQIVNFTSTVNVSFPIFSTGSNSIEAIAISISSPVKLS